jgi:hypothetical protein
MDKIITDNKWKAFLYGYELTNAERKKFDYMDAEEIDCAVFFRYRKSVYCLHEFERSNYNNYTGQLTETFFSAILVKVSEDGEYYKVASVYC